MRASKSVGAGLSLKQETASASKNGPDDGLKLPPVGRQRNVGGKGAQTSQKIGFAAYAAESHQSKGDSKIVEKGAAVSFNDYQNAGNRLKNSKSRPNLPKQTQ